VIDLNEENYIMYAIKCYESPHCVMSEFEEDMKRIKYIKRLIGRYKNTGDLKERLILNHIIVLSNVFGTENAVRLLFFKIEPAFWPVLKSFLIFLQYMPDWVWAINGKNIDSKAITIDFNVTRRLADI
jgi:hypothetical protein